MKKTAVVTGAGSGVGRALAVLLASKGWRVAAIGRRASALLETIQAAGPAGDSIFSSPCDISNPEEVDQMARRVLALYGEVEVLVNSAGTNTPVRGLAQVTFGNYQRIVDTNLTGAYLCVQAFLPGMREHGSGTIVNIVSDAGKQANAKAGPAYVMSKFGLTGLTQSINAEERAHGVRACAVFPGDIDTPLLQLRPAPPTSEARAKMLRPEDVAECAWLAINLPPHAIVEEILIRPR